MYCFVQIFDFKLIGSNFFDQTVVPIETNCLQIIMKGEFLTISTFLRVIFF